MISRLEMKTACAAQAQTAVQLLAVLTETPCTLYSIICCRIYKCARTSIANCTFGNQHSSNLRSKRKQQCSWHSIASGARRNVSIDCCSTVGTATHQKGLCTLYFCIPFTLCLVLLYFVLCTLQQLRHCITSSAHSDACRISLVISVQLEQQHFAL